VLVRADELERRGEGAAARIAAETGGLSGSARFNVVQAAEILRELAAGVTAPLGEVVTCHEPATLSMAERAPMGIVAFAALWMAPLILGVLRRPSPPEHAESARVAGSVCGRDPVEDCQGTGVVAGRQVERKAVLAE
jgi:hypothetical protein